MDPFLKLKECSQNPSLPTILGSRFGHPMRVYAAIVTALGLVMLLGWELAISNRTVTAQASAAMNWTPEQSVWYARLFLILAIATAISYTAMSGLRANVIAARILNAIKILFLGSIAALSLKLLAEKSPGALTAALFPSFSQIASNFGIVALITNFVFNLVWQIIDASAWESVLAADPKARENQSRLLRISAIYIFVFVGLFGSVIGMSLVGTNGVDPDNILLKAVTRFDGFAFALLIGLFVTLACCLVTFADGILLMISQAMTDDLSDSLSGFRKSPTVRALVMGLVALCAWIVVKIVESSSFGLFNFVYLLIVPQLSLIGAVVSLRWDCAKRLKPYLAAACGLALLTGIGFVFVGFLRDVKWAMEVAGSAAIIASLAPILLCCSKPPHHD